MAGPTGGGIGSIKSLLSKKAGPPLLQKPDPQEEEVPWNTEIELDPIGGLGSMVEPAIDYDVSQHLDKISVGVDVKISKNYNSFGASLSATFDVPADGSVSAEEFTEAAKKWVASKAISHLNHVFGTLSPTV
jgi:hypothetical protein